MIRCNNIIKMHLVGDLHFGIRSNSMEWLQIQLDFWNKTFIPKITSSKTYNKETEVLFLMGDVFHSREFLNIRILFEVQKLFKEVSKYFHKIVVIAGNHDLFFANTTEVNSIKQLELLGDNIHIIETPDILDINGTKFFMMPYEHDYAKFEEIVNKDSIGCDYMLCHADIQNMKFDKNRVIEGGLNLKNIRKFKKIYSGHVHYRQEKEWVLYTGIPYSMERSDCGNQKGWYTLNFDKNCFTEEFIENHDSPIFIKTNLHEIIEHPLDLVIENIKNNFVDIYVDNKYSGKFIISQFLELIKDSGVRKIDFFPYDSEKVEEINEALKTIDNKSLNTFEAAQLYLDGNNYDDSTKKIVYAFFEKLYSEAKEMNNKLNIDE